MTDTDSYVFTPRENGLFVLLATFKGRDYERVAAAIETELGRISQEGIAPWEVEKAKNLVRASYIYGAESVQGKARLIGNFETLADDPAYADRYLQRSRLGHRRGPVGGPRRVPRAGKEAHGGPPAQKDLQPRHLSARQRLAVRLQQEHGKPQLFLYDRFCGGSQGREAGTERELQPPLADAAAGDERPRQPGHCAENRHPGGEYQPREREKRVRPFRAVSRERFWRGPRAPERPRRLHRHQRRRAEEGEGRGLFRDAQA